MITIYGYNFGENIDMSPISERMKKFKNSQLVFENVTFHGSIQNLLYIKQMYN